MAARYSILEEEFNPLELNARISPVFEWLKAQPENISQYLQPLQYVTVMRLLKQVRGWTPPSVPLKLRP